MQVRFILSLLILAVAISTCDKDNEFDAPSKYHQTTILLDKIGLETCKYEGPEGNNIIFRYFYQKQDSNKATSQIYSQITYIDSVFDTFYYDRNNILLKQFTGTGPDSLYTWREYRIRCMGFPHRRVSVMYRKVKSKEDSDAHDDWIAKLEECHNE